MLFQSKMVQLSVILLVTYLTASYGLNHTACNKLCTTVFDRRLEGYDSILGPVYVNIPRCTTFYNDVGCYFIKHPPKTECKPSCLPSSSKIITKQLRTGPKGYEIIEGCHFVETTCKHCKRRSYKVKYFEFSKYEKEVDVGRCIGQCDGSGGNGSVPGFCVPVKNTTIIVPGPNGMTVVPVIEKCRCESSCYRFSHLEAFLERKHNSYPTIAEKMIDVGKCVGRCTEIIPEECLNYDYQTNTCIFKLPATRGFCRPTGGETVTFTRVDGKNVSVPVITGCGCTRG